MRRAAFARRGAADHLGAVGDGLFGMEGALVAGEALADDLGILVDENGHEFELSMMIWRCADFLPLKARRVTGAAGRVAGYRQGAAGCLQARLRNSSLQFVVARSAGLLQSPLRDRNRVRDSVVSLVLQADADADLPSSSIGELHGRANESRECYTGQPGCWRRKDNLRIVRRCDRNARVQLRAWSCARRMLACTHGFGDACSIPPPHPIRFADR